MNVADSISTENSSRIINQWHSLADRRAAGYTRTIGTEVADNVPLRVNRLQ